MLRNYLKVALRVITRNKAFSLINIAGLAIGLATCMLIMLYILDESSYDQYHRDGGRIYRVAMKASNGESWAAQPALAAAAMKNELPDVEQVTRLVKFPMMDKTLLTWQAGSGNPREDKRFYETNGYYVDSTFFQVFTYDFKWGSPQTALLKPNSIVLSESIATKFFGQADPVGKQLTMGLPFGDFPYTIQGVFRDETLRSHIPAHFLLSMKNNDVGTWVDQQTSWTMTNIFHTYARLKEGADVAFERNLNRMLQRHAGAELRVVGISKNLFIQPLTKIYLHSSIGDEIAPNGNIRTLYILGSIAVFLLVIACINFMNLSTARSEKRAREVGVRKVLGAVRRSLIAQFLGESFLMCLIALALAALLAWLLLPVFNDLTHKNLQPLQQPGLLFWIVGLALLTGLLAGLYPAIYLSSFQPVSVLKGRIGRYFSAAVIRRVLVVFQFSVSIGLILGAVVIWRQMNLLEDQDLGFAKDQQIILPLQSKEMASHYTSLKDELLKSPGIRSVTSGSTYPGIANINDMLFYGEGKTIKDFVDIVTANIENDYLPTLGLQLIHGRAFHVNSAADTSSLIVNETALKALGYDAAHAVGKPLYYEWQGVRHNMQIIGVVRDFNFQGLQESIKPYAFTTVSFFGNKYAYLIASMQGGHYNQTLADVEKAWNKANPTAPFEYSFLDEDFQRNYEKERQSSKIVMDFTAIAVLVACLGLFGLAAFSAEQRRKEIGIRKVLGASSFSITALLSRDFVKLVVIAILIASPLSAYVMTRWLEHFAYRVAISWWMFLAAAVLALVVALLTVSIQSARSAMANPVESLRNE